MFTIDDVDDILDLHEVKKEAAPTPVPRPVTTRSKSIAHKRKKASGSVDEFESTEQRLYEAISDVSSFSPLLMFG